MDLKQFTKRYNYVQEKSCGNGEMVTEELEAYVSNILVEFQIEKQEVHNFKLNALQFAIAMRLKKFNV